MKNFLIKKDSRVVLITKKEQFTFIARENLSYEDITNSSTQGLYYKRGTLHMDEPITDSALLEICKGLGLTCFSRIGIMLVKIKGLEHHLRKPYNTYYASIKQ